jgi:glycosyltransferase involved in cell wall biosynthesis
MLTSTKTGLVIDQNESLLDISLKISRILDDPETPDRCRALAMQHFDMDASVDRYLGIYEKMQY